MKLKRLCLLSGAPGSGKSTWAHEYMKNHPEIVYISRDEIRKEMLGENDRYFAKEKAVFREYARRAKEALKDESKTVILDATHINFASVRKIITALNWEEEFSMICFNISLATLLRRNAQREGFARVPDKAIKDMLSRQDNPFEYCNDIYIINEKGEVSHE